MKDFMLVWKQSNQLKKSIRHEKWCLEEVAVVEVEKMQNLA